MTQQKTPQQQFKAAMIDVLYPVLMPVLKGLTWLLELPIKRSNERNRRKILDRQLEGLTDPGFLDRVAAGEKNV